jgi:hypothetical protein
MLADKTELRPIRRRVYAIPQFPYHRQSGSETTSPPARVAKARIIDLAE